MRSSKVDGLGTPDTTDTLCDDLRYHGWVFVSTSLHTRSRYA